MQFAEEKEKVSVHLLKKRIKGTVLFLAHLRTKRGGNTAVSIAFRPYFLPKMR